MSPNREFQDYKLPPNHPATPSYVLVEKSLRNNLLQIRELSQEADVEFILAFKAYALWKSFPIIREYIRGCTASSIFEAKMGYDLMKCKTHTYAPAYKDTQFEEILKYSSHISFNSICQFNRFYPRVLTSKYGSVSCGIRINPEYSPIETDLYNPCANGSRLGILSKDLPKQLPKGIDGFHCHNHCESTSYDLEKTLKQIEKNFSDYLPHLKWLNLGGGHLVTHKKYDKQHFIKIIKDFKAKYNHLKIIFEPGSAFVWQTGYLTSSVLDIVENNGVKTLIVDSSFTAHMPDCLEMPYQPEILDAKIGSFPAEGVVYRIGGNSCLSGDYIGDWTFRRKMEIGDVILFKDMIHYTTVKTTMFNGIPHPDIWIRHEDCSYELYREFTYQDYLDRMC